MALVKKISIHFPPYSTYDLTFDGVQCVEHSSSAIELEDCLIDPTTYTIWITPKQKNSYINSHSLVIETKGESIINPINSASIDLNTFVVKYYTWDGDQEPGLFTNSDDYVFFKQDSTNIASSAVNFVTAYVPKHTDAKLFRENFVNEFEPSSGDIGNDRMRTPL